MGEEVGGEREIITFIIQEYHEEEFIDKMIAQLNDVAAEGEEIELCFITASPAEERSYVRKKADFPVKIVGRVWSCGAARNTGAIIASPRSEALFFFDCHVCFTPEAIESAVETLRKYPNALLGMPVRVVDFPSCEVKGATGYGVTFRFTKHPFEWVWYAPSSDERIFAVPTVCGCAFAMTPQVFRHFYEFGGFLWQHRRLGWEEEHGFRLWRLQHPVIVDKRAEVGHLFKQSWKGDVASDWQNSRILGIYLNADRRSCEEILRICSQKGWDTEKALRWAREHGSPIRKKLKRYPPLNLRRFLWIDENWRWIPPAWWRKLATS